MSEHAELKYEIKSSKSQGQGIREKVLPEKETRRQSRVSILDFQVIDLWVANTSNSANIIFCHGEL